MNEWAYSLRCIGKEASTFIAPFYDKNTHGFFLVIEYFIFN